MARFNATGIDGLMLSMQEFAEIPDDVVEDMLDAAASVTIAAHKRKLTSLGLVRTHALVNSLKARKKVGSTTNGNKRYVLVYPSGTHGIYRRKQVEKNYKNSKSGRTYKVGGDLKPTTNAELGFIYEFGAPRKNIQPRQWMREANEDCADDVVRAELAVYDKWLKSKNL